MARNKKHRLIFELSKSERESRLMSVLNESVKLAVYMKQLFVYRNNLCIQPNTGAVMIMKPLLLHSSS
jgi:hypothetical protein